MFGLAPSSSYAAAVNSSGVPCADSAYGTPYAGHFIQLSNAAPAYDQVRIAEQLTPANQPFSIHSHAPSVILPRVPLPKEVVLGFIKKILPAVPESENITLKAAINELEQTQRTRPFLLHENRGAALSLHLTQASNYAQDASTADAAASQIAAQVLAKSVTLPLSYAFAQHFWELKDPSAVTEKIKRTRVDLYDYFKRIYEKFAKHPLEQQLGLLEAVADLRVACLVNGNLRQEEWEEVMRTGNLAYYGFSLHLDRYLDNLICEEEDVFRKIEDERVKNLRSLYSLHKDELDIQLSREFTKLEHTARVLDALHESLVKITVQELPKNLRHVLPFPHVDLPGKEQLKIAHEVFDKCQKILSYWKFVLRQFQDVYLSIARNHQGALLEYDLPTELDLKLRFKTSAAVPYTELAVSKLLGKFEENVKLYERGYSLVSELVLKKAEGASIQHQLVEHQQQAGPSGNF